MTDNNSFKFYANFLYAIEKLPEEKRASACYEFCKFGITGELPKDENVAMFCVGVSASVQKYQGRGGNHNPSGINQWSNEVKNGQRGQRGLKKQTETKTETKTKYNIPTLDDVKKYIQEKRLNVDAQKFFDYYDVAGWKDSQGKKVLNWKQKMLANWVKEDKKESDGWCGLLDDGIPTHLLDDEA